MITLLYAITDIMSILVAGQNLVLYILQTQHDILLFFQYFATVESSTGNDEEEVKWIPVSIIERTIPSQRPTDVPDMVGSGESVGGVVSDTVGE